MKTYFISVNFENKTPDEISDIIHYLETNGGVIDDYFVLDLEDEEFEINEEDIS